MSYKEIKQLLLQIITIGSLIMYSTSITGCGILFNRYDYHDSNQKFYKYIDERLVTMKNTGMDYIYIEIVPTGGAGKKVGYFLYEDNSKFYYQKITSDAKYEPRLYGMFLELLMIVSTQNSYDWIDDTTLPNREFITHDIVFRVQTNQLNTTKNFRLLLDQIYDDKEVPAKRLLQKFIQSISLTEIREMYIKE